MAWKKCKLAPTLLHKHVCKNCYKRLDSTELASFFLGFMMSSILHQCQSSLEMRVCPSLMKVVFMCYKHMYLSCSSGKL